MSEKKLIRQDENYFYMRTKQLGTVQRHPTPKRIAELNSAHGDEWYLEFLEPETRARMGK